MGKGLGGGVFIGGSRNPGTSSGTMDEGASVSGNRIVQTNGAGQSMGGGIAVDEDTTSTLTMRGNASVSGNSVEGYNATAKGGGIAIGGSIVNYPESGPAVIITGNAFVSGNRVYSESNTNNIANPTPDQKDPMGGGIYLESLGEYLVMDGNASVYGNTVEAGSTLNALGGGIAVSRTDYAGSSHISLYGNSSIAGNSVRSAQGDALGGGVYLRAGLYVDQYGTSRYSTASFNLYSGRIYGNDADTVFSLSLHPFRIPFPWHQQNQVMKGGSPYEWKAVSESFDLSLEPIVWTGSSAAEIGTNRNEGWAYYNTTDKKAYVFRMADKAWFEMPANSIVWLGFAASDPSPLPNPGNYRWAYYNTADNTARLYINSAWQDWFTRPSLSPPVDWRGSYASAPENAAESWAYFNTVDKKVYMYVRQGGGSAIYKTQDATVNIWDGSTLFPILTSDADEDGELMRTILTTSSGTRTADGAVLP